jgi:hypothetical protein
MIIIGNSRNDIGLVFSSLNKRRRDTTGKICSILFRHSRESRTTTYNHYKRHSAPKILNKWSPSAWLWTTVRSAWNGHPRGLIQRWRPLGHVFIRDCARPRTWTRRKYTFSTLPSLVDQTSGQVRTDENKQNKKKGTHATIDLVCFVGTDQNTPKCTLDVLNDWSHWTWMQEWQRHWRELIWSFTGVHAEESRHEKNPDARTTNPR